MLNSVVGQGVCGVKQSIADLEETNTSQEWVRAVGKA